MSLLDNIIDDFLSLFPESSPQEEDKTTKYYEAYVKNFYAKHLSMFSYKEEEYRKENGYFSSVAGINSVYEFNQEDYPIPPVPEGAIDLEKVEESLPTTEPISGIKDYEKDVFFERFYDYVRDHCKINSSLLEKLFRLVTYERNWNLEYKEQWLNDDTLC